MTRDEINEYLSIESEIDQKRSDFKKSIEPLRKELRDKETAFEESIKDLKDKSDKFYSRFKTERRPIIGLLENILRKKYGFYHSWSIALEEFGIITTSDNEYDLPINSDYKDIEEITDTHVVFNAEKDFRNGDYTCGTIAIPIKYFENPELLEDEEYLKEVFKRVEDRETEKLKKEKEDEIKQLKARIAELEA